MTSTVSEIPVMKIKPKFDEIRLAEECAKLDPAYEQSLAEEGMAGVRGDMSGRRN